jgi:SAM-dependent methyltransferase
MVDRFGPAARAYATFRPRYPDLLFDRIVSLTARHDLAWDCGTGSGQSAVKLGDRFDRVIATDSSAGQLEAAEPHPRVTYVRAAAERTPMPSRRVDLVTVAQALHWFDPDPFFAEVGRVLAPGGIIAVWTYGRPVLGGTADAVVENYHANVVGPYWAPGRRHVETGYRSIPFPFDPLPFPAMEIVANMPLDAFLGYVGTWSATLAYAADQGEDPVSELRTVLEAQWPSAERRRVRWPLTVRVGRTGG